MRYIAAILFITMLTACGGDNTTYAGPGIWVSTTVTGYNSCDKSVYTPFPNEESMEVVEANTVPTGEWLAKRKHESKGCTVFTSELTTVTEDTMHVLTMQSFYCSGNQVPDCTVMVETRSLRRYPD